MNRFTGPGGRSLHVPEERGMVCFCDEGLEWWDEGPAEACPHSPRPSRTMFRPAQTVFRHLHQEVRLPFHPAVPKMQSVVIPGGRFLRLVRLAVFIVAAWTFLGFFFASQQHVISKARGEPENVYEITITVISMT